MSLQTMGSSTLARSSPGSVLRSKDEKRAGVNIAAQAQAAPGGAERSLVEEPLEAQVPLGTKKVLATKPMLDRGTTAPPDLLDMGQRAQAMSAMTPEIQATQTGLNTGTRRAADTLAPKPVTPGGAPTSVSGGAAPGADLALAEQPLSRYLPTEVEGMPLQYKTDRGEVLGTQDKMMNLNNTDIAQVGANGFWADAPGELRSFGQNVTQAFQPVMRSVEQMVQNMPGASVQSQSNPFLSGKFGLRTQASEGNNTTAKLFDPNLLQAITKTVGNAISSIPALRSASESLQSFGNNNLRSDDYGILSNLNAASRGQQMPIMNNPTIRTMASNVGAAANNLRSQASNTVNNLRSKAEQYVAPVVQKVNQVVNTIKNFLGGLFR